MSEDKCTNLTTPHFFQITILHIAVDEQLITNQWVVTDSIISMDNGYIHTLLWDNVFKFWQIIESWFGFLSASIFLAIFSLIADQWKWGCGSVIW